MFNTPNNHNNNVLWQPQFEVERIPNSIDHSYIPNPNWQSVPKTQSHAQHNWKYYWDPIPEILECCPEGVWQNYGSSSGSTELTTNEVGNYGQLRPNERVDMDLNGYMEPLQQSYYPCKIEEPELQSTHICPNSNGTHSECMSNPPMTTAYPSIYPIKSEVNTTRSELVDWDAIFPITTKAQFEKFERILEEDYFEKMHLVS